MIIKCDYCKKEYNQCPSWIKRHKHNYCCRECYLIDSKESRIENLTKVGVNTRFKPGHITSKNRILPVASAHRLWKGDDVGYRGLHYWLRRQKGVPQICIHCGATKNVQWANIDGQYRRDVADYISLCASCHKVYDLSIKPTT